MKSATALLGIGVVVFGAATAASVLAPPPNSGSATKSKVALALDTLEAQLQRRFHDRNNMTFGYERVIRVGARRHNSVLMNKIGDRMHLAYDDAGNPAQSRVSDTHEYEIEIAPGKWVPYSLAKETMHAENDAEQRAIGTLRNSGLQVAIYTAGMFQGDGVPARLKGPAYLRQLTPTAPPADSIAEIAERSWIANSAQQDLKTNGWTYRVVKVIADDQSCINCHSGQLPAGQTAPQLGKPIGVFLIATR